jgi:hypothetical protein
MVPVGRGLLWIGLRSAAKRKSSSTEKLLTEDFSTFVDEQIAARGVFLDAP